VAQRLTGVDFNSLIRYFHDTAFRLETRPFYTVSEEREAYEGFLAGRPEPLTAFGFFNTWRDQIADLTARGRRVERVRLIDDPPSDYQRWEIWAGPFSVDAGESIRYLSRLRAIDLGIPDTNAWWLFDLQRLAQVQFDEEGRPLGGEIITDPDIMAQHCAWRDLAVQHASDPVQGTTPGRGHAVA
jgi:hypothetical protein